MTTATCPTAQPITANILRNERATYAHYRRVYLSAYDAGLLRGLNPVLEGMIACREEALRCDAICTERLPLRVEATTGRMVTICR